MIVAVPPKHLIVSIVKEITKAAGFVSVTLFKESIQPFKSSTTKVYVPANAFVTEESKEYIWPGVPE